MTELRQAWTSLDKGLTLRYVNSDRPVRLGDRVRGYKPFTHKMGVEGELISFKIDDDMPECLRVTLTVLDDDGISQVIDASELYLIEEVSS